MTSWTTIYSPDPETVDLLDSKVRGYHWLIEADFSSGTGRYTTSPVKIDSPNGHSYIALGHFLQIEDLTETSRPDTGTLNIQIGLANKTLFALLSGDQSVYRGKPIRIYAQFLTGAFAPKGMPVKRWTGIMDCASVRREKATEEGEVVGYIEVPCIRHGFERARLRQGMRMTSEQQRHVYPNDLFFQYIDSLIEKPSPWVTVAFQKQK